MTEALHSKPTLAIVGTGLSGYILSHALQDHFQITMFERGPVGGATPDDLELTGHHTGMSPINYYGVGGTTQLWAGGLIDLLPDEMAAHWPLSVIDDLPRYYGHVVDCLYGTTGSANWRDRTHERLNQNAYLTSLYYNPSPFRVSGLKAFGSSDIRTDCFVSQVTEDDSRALVCFQKDSDLTTEHFDFAIVAAGGLNSPLIMKRSHLGSPMVGAHFTDHPMGFVAKISGSKNNDLFQSLRFRKNKSDTTNRLLKIRDEQTGLWSSFYLRAAATGAPTTDPYRRSFQVLAERNKFRRIASAVMNFHDLDFMYQAVEDRFQLTLPSRHSYVLVVNEQPALNQGEVEVQANGKARRNWHVGPEIEQAIERNLSHLQDLLECELIPTEGPIIDRLFSAAHLSGTCRISETPNEGVVDDTLAVHGARRIYVCDGSVLPSSGSSNTGLTIGALAFRLADQLQRAIA